VARLCHKFRLVNGSLDAPVQISVSQARRCFVYVLARATGETLLFKGDDFALTDIRIA
jgi:hypothetical protein